MIFKLVTDLAGFHDGDVQNVWVVPVIVWVVGRGGWSNDGGVISGFDEACELDARGVVFSAVPGYVFRVEVTRDDGVERSVKEVVDVSSLEGGFWTFVHRCKSEFGVAKLKVDA